MMDPRNVASQSDSQTSNASNPPLAEAIMPTLPVTGAVTPAFNYAIALQQYQFQQSLVNQQLLAQQQAVAHAVSIKAAAERAAARAAEISMLLSGENKVVLEERSEDLVPKREKSGSKSCSRSASPPQSSKPNTVSPVRYRNSRREPEEYSPRDSNGYGNRRNSGYYSRYNDLRGYSRSSYRRGEDYSGIRSYFSNNNTSRSRRRSPLSRSRNRHGDSRSPRRRVGSRSPRRCVGSRSRRRRVGSRSPRRCVGSRSPRRRDGSHSPHRHRIRSPSPMSGRRTSSRISTRPNISKSPVNSGSSSSPLHTRKGSPRKAAGARSVSSLEDSPIHNTANLLLEENKGADAMNTSEINISANLNARWQEREAKPPWGNLLSGRSNTDHSSKINTQEPASMDHSSSDNSQGRTVRRGLGSRDCESGSDTSVPPRYTDNINHPTQMLDVCSNRNNGDIENRKGGFGMINGKGEKLHEEEKKHVNKYKNREIRASKESTHKSLNMHEQELPQKVISSNGEDSASIPGECAVYPLPEGHESMDVKEVDFSSPKMVPDGDVKVDGNVSTSPKVRKHPERRHKRRSISRDRRSKHSKRHHKKHRDESEEEGADEKRESREKKKLKKSEKKSSERHHKSHDERKWKRKHRDVPSSSSSDDSSSLSGDEQNARRTSTSSRKKRSSAAPRPGQASNEHNAKSLIDNRDTN